MEEAEGLEHEAGALEHEAYEGGPYEAVEHMKAEVERTLPQIRDAVGGGSGGATIGLSSVAPAMRQALESIRAEGAIDDGRQLTAVDDDAEEDGLDMFTTISNGMAENYDDEFAAFIADKWCDCWLENDVITGFPALP